MKNKYHSRFIAIFVVVSMLLTCMIMPATATASTESLNPAVNIVASDDLLTDDELLLSDEKTFLRADDPIIAKDSIMPLGKQYTMQLSMQQKILL